MKKQMAYAIALAFLMGSGTAMAQSSGSEFFWQAGADQHYITPSLDYSTRKEENKGGGDDKAKGPTLSVKYDYGINETWALDAKLAYSSFKNTPASTTDKGLEDLAFGIKGSFPMDSVVLKAGTDLGISLGDAEVKSNGDGNRYSGRHTLTPYFGVEVPVSTDMHAGFYLSRELGLTDMKIKTAGAGTAKFSGYEKLSLKAFFESVVATGKLGAALVYTNTNDVKAKAGGAKTEVPNTLGLDVYGAFEVAPGIDLLGNLGYHKLNSTDTLSGGNEFGIGFGARITL